VISLPQRDVKPTTCRELSVADRTGRFGPPPDLRWEVGLTWLYHGLRLVLAGIFIYAGLIKLLDPRAFAHTIAQYDLVPEALLPLVAVGLPALELLGGVGLICEVRGSLTIMAGLLLIFLMILGYAVWLDLDIDCGCFTADELDTQHSVRIAFWRDLLMLGSTFFLHRWRRTRAPHRLWIGKLTKLLKGESTQ
jgi:uncharacterized membrane protein YphA (DoxX/SURF4 family)